MVTLQTCIISESGFEMYNVSTPKPQMLSGNDKCFHCMFYHYYYYHSIQVYKINESNLKMLGKQLV